MKSGVEETLIRELAPQGFDPPGLLIGVIILSGFVAAGFGFLFRRRIERFSADALVRIGWVVLSPLGMVEGQPITRAEVDPSALTTRQLRGIPVSRRDHPMTWFLGQAARLLMAVAFLGIFGTFGFGAFSIGPMLVKALFLAFVIWVIWGIWKDMTPWSDRLDHRDAMRRWRWDDPRNSIRDPD